MMSGMFCTLFVSDGISQPPGYADILYVVSVSESLFVARNMQGGRARTISMKIASPHTLLAL